MIGDSNNLVLGCAQLGFNYGINNQQGVLEQPQATALVKEAFNQGIRIFDTAQHYGRSEEMLGQAFATLGVSEQVKVITKLDPAIDPCNEELVYQSMTASLKRLHVNRLDGLMLHDVKRLHLWQKGIDVAMRRVRDSGKVDHIGVSVYYPQEALDALTILGIDFVQLPSNACDQRFERAGVFKLAKDLGKEVYVRSVFLQGLLVMEQAKMPASMVFASNVVGKFSALAARSRLSRMELAFGYVRTKWPNAKIVFGAETVDQVKMNVQLNNIELTKAQCQDIEELFVDVDESIINPSLWPARQ